MKVDSSAVSPAATCSFRRWFALLPLLAALPALVARGQWKSFTVFTCAVAGLHYYNHQQLVIHIGTDFNFFLPIHRKP